MNEQQFENKVRRDAIKTKNDIDTLVGDGVSRVSEGFEKMKSDAEDTWNSAAKTVKKDLGQGLKQYNSKAQEYAESFPGGFSKNVAKYPWVAISIGLAFGILLGTLLKPSRQT